jgi:hypothetical protein
MALDIAGMLTGVSNQPVNPNLSVQQQQLAMGANATNMMQGGMESMRRSAGGSVPMAEQLAMAMSQLDLSNPADLAKLAKIQQATGDLAGAAQTASKINAMQQAKIDETRAVARESRASETFKLGKEDRDAGILKDAALLKRQTAQDTREEKRLALSEEAGAREKLRLEETLNEKEKANAIDDNLRSIYIAQAKSEGKDNLAAAIKDGLSLSAVPALLYKTSTAQVVSPKGDEKNAYDEILQSPAMQAKITDVLDDEKFFSFKTWRFGKLTDKQEEAIFYKTKEIRQSMGNQITVEQAMVKAIEAITDLATAPLTPEQIEAAKKAAEANAALNGGPPDDDSDKDSFGNIKK